MTPTLIMHWVNYIPHVQGIRSRRAALTTCDHCVGKIERAGRMLPTVPRKSILVSPTRAAPGPISVPPASANNDRAPGPPVLLSFCDDDSFQSQTSLGTSAADVAVDRQALALRERMESEARQHSISEYMRYKRFVSGDGFVCSTRLHLRIHRTAS